MTLSTAPFGTTGMQITRVGLGAWAIGGGDWFAGWGPQDDQESIDAIRYAVHAGINWVDTAAVYGLGHSEEIVARALEDLPAADRPHVFTKCGLVWDQCHPREPARRVGRPESIRDECTASLRRLGVEQIDLLQMHWPAEDGTDVDDYWGTLVELRSEGKIAAAGLSNHDATQLARAEAIGHVDSLQPPFSAINRTAAAAELPWCAQHATGVIVYSPMESGLLSGAFSRERLSQLDEGDWRRSWPAFLDGIDAKLELAASLAPVAQRHKTTTAAVAVAWTLAWSGVSAAIVGARRPAQVDGWLNAGSLELNGDDVDEIAAAIQRSGAGSGPANPVK